MTTIQALLNPVRAEVMKQRTGKDTLKRTSAVSKTYDHETISKSSYPRKKQKIGKDAPVFIRGPIRGKCRYPPHEYQDELLASQHQNFELYPVGDIALFPRHIPYNSDKKTFQEITGREYLEVFQYQFRIPGEEITYSMLWDYNIGLVRTTPLFKCCGYSKTTPAKMLNRNPGLREICHSITGGSLVAQGYWIPYDAAKAIAATFCWSIRHVLTPVFGIDFPQICIHPDSAKFGSMLIDPEITKRCAQQAVSYRELEETNSSRASSATPGPITPTTPTYPKSVKLLREKALQIAASTNGYSTDGSSDDNHSLGRPPGEYSLRNPWMAVNIPRSTRKMDVFPLEFQKHADSAEATKRYKTPYSAFSEVFTPDISPKTRSADIEWHERHTTEIDFNTNSRGDSEERNVSSIQVLSDKMVAFLLMSMRLQRLNNCGQKRSRKRRAST